jgi:predicted nucleotide-binding protein
MAKGRTAGTKNRNYPPLGLAEALRVPRVIQDEASGMEVSRLTLAELLNVSPASSNFRELVASSRFYGLTNGGINADEFSLTPLGNEATGGDEVAQVAAYKQAVMNVPPYKTFFATFSNKKIPSATAFKEFLTRSANVAAERADECMQFILADAQTAGLARSMKGGAQYVDLSGTPSTNVDDHEEAEDALDLDARDAVDVEPKDEGDKTPETETTTLPRDGKPKKVFIAHGRNRTPLDQLKNALDTFKVRYAVAIDEPNAGRPISRKVAALMRDECSSGIFIFTADERFARELADGETEEVWRPSENVVFELGAASILYENRIVIFKEKGVTFPTDFSDLGYIEFEKDQLVAELGSLFSELVSLDILEVRAKG